MGKAAVSVLKALAALALAAFPRHADVKSKKIKLGYTLGDWRCIKP